MTDYQPHPFEPYDEAFTGTSPAGLLAELRAAEHDDVTYPSDAAFTAFLAEVDPDQARLDLVPHTEIEIRHLAHIRSAA